MKREEIEQIFIGSIICKPDNLAVVKDLSLSTREGIASYAAAVWLYERNNPVNIQSLAMKAGLEYAGWINEAADVGVGKNSLYIANLIKERDSKRRIITGLNQIAESIEISDVQTTLDNIRDLYGSELIDGNESGTIAESMTEFEEQVEKYKIAGNIGIDTGFCKWQNAYITYEPGHLIAIGGFTSVGKTATALEFVGRLGRNNGIAIFSMEMTKPQIISRMLSRLTGYSSRLILAGKINDTALKKAKRYLESQPLHIFRKTRNWSEISNACRVLKMKGQLDIAFFDYQQNIGAPGRSTHDKMEYISRSSQDLVQDLEITGVMLSQISLQQSRDDSGNPEFKGGGGLAECADIALHLSRPKSNDHELLVEMRKNRHGPKINLLLEYQSNYTRLEEIG